MIVQKWDHRNRVYNPHKIPDDWKVATFCSSMGTLVNCAQCGKLMHYGDCYTSREIHNPAGIGFAVCEDCYEAEWTREMEAQHEK